ncbi:MAG: hypothetical protein ACPLSO_02945 [Fervidicoccaceae archaeon]
MRTEEIFEKAREEYNKYRDPEARAEIVEVDEGKGEAVIKIEGSFCRTCGVDDWIDDFKYVLEDLGVNAKIVEYEIYHERDEAKARFRIEIPKK